MIPSVGTVRAFLRAHGILLLLLLPGCASENPPDRQRTSATVIRLPDAAAYVLGSVDADDPHQQWQALSLVWFLDPSTVVFGDTENRVVALGVDGVGKWIFDADDPRYNFGGQVRIGAEDDRVLAYAEPTFVALGADGEVVEEERVEPPVLRGRERVVAVPEAVSADFVVFSEVRYRPPLRQALHIVDTRGGEPVVVAGLPTARWDDDDQRAAGGRNRDVSAEARHGLIVYSARGDSTVTVRDMRMSEAITLRTDFPVYGTMVDADSRVWVFNLEGGENGRPNASVFTRAGDHLFEYWGSWPRDAMGSRILVLKSSEVERSHLEIHIFDLLDRLPTGVE